MAPLTDPMDAAFLADLREAGIVTPASLERMDEALGRPERVCLNRLLLTGRSWIDVDAWLCWLVRRHGCTRIGPVKPPVGTPAGRPFEGPDLAEEPNLPFGSTEAGIPLIAVLRPDLRGATLARLAVSAGVWSAATLNELHTLRERHRPPVPSKTNVCRSLRFAPI